MSISAHVKRPASDIISRAAPGRIPRRATHDRLERDADRRADQALAASRSADHSLRSIRSAGKMRAAVPVMNAVSHVVGGPGTALEPTIRRDMEQRFGENFSHVRVHTGSAAERSASGVHACAYTIGNHIVFGAEHSPSDRRLLAHELAHVVQQSEGQPMLLRKPKPVTLDPAVDRSPPDPGIRQWTPADAVVELRRLSGGDWEIVLSGFTSAESARTLLWPKWWPKDVAPMTLKVAITDPIERGWFTISGLTFWHLQHMEASIAALFRDRGLVDQTKESPELANARNAFRKHNSGLEDWALGMIDRGLRKAAEGNADLMLAFYRYYSSHDLKREDMSALGDTKYGNTKIATKLLLQEPKQATSDPLKLLGGTLIHEFAHTPQGGWLNDVEKVVNEAKAYAIEVLFAERMGDKKRVEDIDKMWSGNETLKRNTGAYEIFNRSYRIISKLYEIIDSRGGAEAAAARRMSVEFISKNEADYGRELRDFISRL